MTRQLVMRALAAARRWPCKWFLAIVIVSLGLGEWYPFSNFPMYASLGRETWYVYVTDGADQPVATVRQFGEKTIPLRKIFATRLARLQASPSAASPAEQNTAAGRHVLEYLLHHGRPPRGAPPLPERLRLWRTIITVRDRRIERRRDLLAELAVP